MQPETRGLLDHVTYGVELNTPVPDGEVERVAAALIAQRGYSRTPSQYLAAIDDALRADARIARPHENEQHLRAYLARLHEQLEAARPWPEPGFRARPASERPDLMDAPVLLRIPLTETQVGARLNQQFRRTGLPRAAIVLALTDGPQIALTAPFVPGPDDVEVRARGIDAGDLGPLLSRTTGLPSLPA